MKDFYSTITNLFFRARLLAVFPALLLLGLSASEARAQVNVTASGGTANATYATLGDAVAAVNAGTHTGAVTLDIAGSTFEAVNASTVLNSSGAGSASYTSILIRPIADNIIVSGASATGRGLLELNGADNVTIDGDNPNSAGINRNLTFSNSAAPATNFTSVIRIALATTGVTSADNVTIRNLNIAGSAVGRNVSTAASSTGSENTTYGILAAGGASGATAAPTAVTSVSTNTIGTGATASNLLIDNNAFQSAARAVAVQGSATGVFPGLRIVNNFIGNPTAGDANQVTGIGITAQGSADGLIANNTIYVEGFVPSSASNQAIGVGTVSASGTFTVERNLVNRMRNNNPGGWTAFGINIAGGTASVVRNNFVSGIINTPSTANTFSTAFGAFGIRVAGGTNHLIYHNSVNLSGNIPGAFPALSGAFAVSTANATGVDARNNIFANTQTQTTATTPASSALVSVYLPPSATSTFNLTLNNNAYYQGTAANSGIGQVGQTAGTGFYTAANFDPSSTAPATNFRSYTSTLNAAGTNDNASFATTNAPPFVSSSNLRIPAGTVTRLESGGAPIGVANDIDNETRSASAPDIGADEFAGATPPANDIAAVAIITPANNSTVGTATTFTPSASFNNAGLSPQTNVTVRFTITNSSGTVVYNQTATITTINPGASATITFPSATLTTAGTYTTTATAELAGDQNAANNSVSGTVNAVAPLAAGTYTVGTNGNFPSLTNSGGIFEALNAAGATGNIVISIASDLTGETGSFALNELPSGVTATIRPANASRTISGSSATGLLTFNGTDFVTLDGSLSGGTDRNLTITNTGGGGILYFANGANGARNNTIKNLSLIGGSPTATLIAVAFAGNTFGNAGIDNDNNRVENNNIQSVLYGVYSIGESAANPNTGVFITRNQFSNIGRIAIFTGNDDGVRITLNSITNINTGINVDSIAIGAGAQVLGDAPPTAVSQVNALISRNYISGIQNTATFSAAGIVLASGASGTNRVDNNMISGVIGNSNAGDVVAGIYVVPAAGATQNIYYNSVSMTGDRGGATANLFPSYALAVTADQPVNVVNNALLNSQTRTGATGGGGESYAFAINVSTFANINSNNNDLFVSGPVGVVGITGDLTTAAQGGTAGTGTNQPTLAAWQAATGKDLASLSVDPQFISLTDLHIQTTSPLQDQGVTIAGLTFDFDRQLRGGNQPPQPGDEIGKQFDGAADNRFGGGTTDIGADEIFAVTAATVEVGGRVLTADGRGIRNARVTLTDAAGATQTVLTGAFGNYRFVNVAAGQNIIVTATAKRFVFAQSSQIVNLAGEATNIDFVAEP